MEEISGTMGDSEVGPVFITLCTVSPEASFSPPKQACSYFSQPTNKLKKQFMFFWGRLSYREVLDFSLLPFKRMQELTKEKNYETNQPIKMYDSNYLGPDQKKTKCKSKQKIMGKLEQLRMVGY